MNFLALYRNDSYELINVAHIVRIGFGKNNIRLELLEVGEVFFKNEDNGFDNLSAVKNFFGLT